MLVLIRGWVSQREVQEWKSATAASFALNEVREQPDGTTAFLGSGSVDALFQLRDRTEAILQLSGEILPFGFDDVMSYYQAETWFLPEAPDSQNPHCNDPAIHHAYLANGGNFAFGTADPYSSPLWPPAGFDLNPPPGAYPDPYTEPTRRVIEDYFLCSYILDSPVQLVLPHLWCEGLAPPGSQDFYRLFEGNGIPVTNEIVTMEQMDPLLEQEFVDYCEEAGIAPQWCTFGLEITSDPEAVIWLDATTAASAREINNRFQMVIPTWEMYVGRALIHADVVWITPNGVAWPIDMNGDGTDDSFDADLGAFVMHLETGLTIAAGATMNALAQIFPLPDEIALDIDIGWTEIVDATVRNGPEGESQVTANATAFETAKLQAALANPGDDIEPDLLPRAIVQELVSSHGALRDFTDDLEEMLPRYTHGVNPYLTDNGPTVPVLDSLLAVTPAEATIASLLASQCPNDLIPADFELPAIGDPGREEQILWIESAGFVLISGGFNTQLPVQDEVRLSGRTIWLAADTADLAALPQYQAILDPDHLDNPLVRNIEFGEELEEMLTTALLHGMPSVYKDESCESMCDDMVLEHAFHCDDICLEAFQLPMVMPQYDDCTAGCATYLAEVEYSCGKTCGDIDYLFGPIEIQAPIPVPPYFQHVLICASVDEFWPYHAHNDWDGDGEYWYVETATTREVFYSPNTPSGCDAGGAASCEPQDPGDCLVGQMSSPWTYAGTEMMPEPYLAPGDDGVMEVRVPWWADYVYDLEVTLGIDVDKDLLDFQERCPMGAYDETQGGEDDPYWIGNFEPRATATIRGKLRLQLVLEWSHPLYNQRAWQWTGGWRADNGVTNDHAGIAWQPGDFPGDLADDLLPAVAAPQARLGLGVSDVCFEVYKTNIVVDADPAMLLPPAITEASIEDLMWDLVQDPCNNLIADQFRDSSFAGGLLGGGGTTLLQFQPFYGDEFYDRFQQDDVLIRIALAYSFFDDPTAEAPLLPAEFLAQWSSGPSFAGYIEHAVMDLMASLNPAVMNSGTRQLYMKELWETELCDTGTTNFASVEECDDTLMALVGSDDMEFYPGLPQVGLSGSPTPSSTGGLYLAIYDPLGPGDHVDQLAPLWDPEDPPHPDFDTYALDRDYDAGPIDPIDPFDQAEIPIPIWEPGRP